eukprot:m.286451 g.286451  ORF g.286451 m.286451 type:complete len:101 (-) comp22924_c0_seq46:63-365(-)
MGFCTSQPCFRRKKWRHWTQGCGNCRTRLPLEPLCRDPVHGHQAALREQLQTHSKASLQVTGTVFSFRAQAKARPATVDADASSWSVRHIAWAGDTVPVF